MPTISLEKVTKTYKGKGRERRGPAIQDITFQFEQGEFIYLTGSRGAGKTTVLDIIAGELTPDSGAMFVDGVNVKRMGMIQRGRFFRSIGRVSPEKGELVRSQTILQNLIPKKKTGKNVDVALILKSLALVGMGGSENKYPADFSISECRRIELARAILQSPAILLLDEITDRVNDDTVWDMLHLLNELNSSLGTTVIMATNASQVVNVMRKRVITLADGKLVGDVKRGRLGYIG